MILLAGLNSVDLNKYANTVVIGSDRYGYVQIGNYYIITENLRYHTSAYFYPNNDPANEAAHGLLYQFKIMYDEIIPILPSGWRVPTKADFDAMKNIDSASNDYISTLDGGTDTLGTHFRLSGFRNKSSQIIEYQTKCALWSTTVATSESSYSPVYLLNHLVDTGIYTRGIPTSLEPSAVSVRVIKNV